MPGGPNLFLVLFEEGPAPDRERSETAAVENSAEGAEHPDAGGDDSIAALRRELQAKEEYLQATNEELETSNEELKSSNEEMQSVNEELQSTNEELETSKEELQSVNEELATVNAELQQKVTDLSRANNDMNNLLAGTGVGTVFVDLELNITALHSDGHPADQLDSDRRRAADRPYRFQPAGLRPVGGRRAGGSGQPGAQGNRS